VKRLALALLLVLPHAAHAGAWTQDKDHWQTIIGATVSGADTGFDAAGRADVKLRFNKDAFQASTEYGLLNSVTLFLNTETVLARSTEAGTLPIAARDNSFEGGVRLRLTDAIGVLSLQASYKTAGAFDFSVSANSSASGRGEEIRALYGTNFKLLGSDGFLDIEAGERFLSSPRPSETPIDVTLGLHATPSTLLMLQNFNVIGGGNGRPPYAYFRSHKIEFSIVQRLMPGVSLQLGGFVSPLGLNALQEQGASLALWTTF
jgi:hypothetical protein